MMTIESPGTFWKDYELIDSGNFEKLERFGPFIMARPELFADYEITKGKMDDVFLAVTGKKLTGGDLE